MLLKDFYQIGLAFSSQPGSQVRSVRLRVHAPVPGNDRGVEEGEALLDLVVPGQRQDQEEDALLILLRRPEKVPGRSAEVHTGEQQSKGCVQYRKQFS